MNISAEMLASVRACKLDLGPQLTAVYAFIFSRITEAQVQHDLTKLEEALRLLHVERETWQLVCEKFGSQIDAPMGVTSPSELPEEQADAAFNQFDAVIDPLDGDLGSNGSISLQA